MTFSKKADWLIPIGLIAFSAIPIAAGALRMVELGFGAGVTQDNARFITSPAPVTLHILSAALYCVFSAFQFSSGLRVRNPLWHRALGMMSIPCGLIAALSALWMTLFYPSGIYDGFVVYAFRLLAGSGMALSLCIGFGAIRRHDITLHRTWMMRAYALGLGAGTQVLTHLPWFLFPTIHGELARTLFMGAGWAINLAVAEWCISRYRRQHMIFE